MRKWGFLFVLAVFLILPAVSANIEETFFEIQNYLDDYDAGELTAPQLIVMIDYSRNKMYENSKNQEISETEIKKVFDKVDLDKNKNYNDAEYEKIFYGKDFNVVFKARSFVRHDRDYYEARGDSEKFYFIDYNLVSVVSSDSTLEEDLEEFIEEINETVGDETLDYEELQDKFSEIRTLFQKDVNCEEIAESLEFEYEEKDYPSKEKKYYKVIATEIKENCWTDTHCEQKCERKGECNAQPDYCFEKEICEDVCEETFNEVSNETEKICVNECKTEQECEKSEENCWEYDECHDECEDEEKCEEFVDGELRMDIDCSEDWSNLYLGGWNKFERYGPINEGMGWNCESEIQSLVNMRKVIQKDFNEEFIQWYFNEFVGEDYSKIINGGGGLQEVVWKLIRIEEEVSNQLHCSETGEWPGGFEKIDLDYSEGEVHFEVWEKFIPMEGMDVDYYTTMYKYYWAPDKEMAKKIIIYMINNEFGPSAKDLARIKADDGQMALIENFANKYGGSLDIKLNLKEKEGDFEILRYVKINPEDIIGIGEEEIKTDISIEIDFDVLYNFIISMSKRFEGEKINGPYWVQIHEDDGPGNFFGVIGSVSKAWREGITIKPKYALIKLFFNAKDITDFMNSGEAPVSESKNLNKISGEVILEK